MIRLKEIVTLFVSSLVFIVAVAIALSRAGIENAYLVIVLTFGIIMAGLYGVGFKLSKEGIEILPKAGELCTHADRYRIDEIGGKSREVLERGVALVVDEHERLKGIATRRDIGEGKVNPTTERIVYVKKDEDILKIGRKMADNRLTKIPVVDEDNRPIGVVKAPDVIRVIVDMIEMLKKG